MPGGFVMRGCAKFLLPISLAAVIPGVGMWLVLRELDVPTNPAFSFAFMAAVLFCFTIVAIWHLIDDMNWRRRSIGQGMAITEEQTDPIERRNGAIFVALISFCSGWLAFILVAESVVQHTALFDLAPKKALERIAFAPLLVGIKVLGYGAMIGLGVLVLLAVVSLIYEKLRGRPLFPGIGSPPK